MEEITVYTGPDYRIRKQALRDKLAQLKARGLMDAGLVLVNERVICHGYLPEAELEFALGVVDELVKTRPGLARDIGSAIDHRQELGTKALTAIGEGRDADTLVIA